MSAHGEPSEQRPLEHSPESSGARTRDPDALDLLNSEDQMLALLLEHWHAGDDGTGPEDHAVTGNWDQGTVAKLLLEHGAVRLAAAEEVCSALESSGRTTLACRVGDGNDALRAALDRMDELARGVNGVSLATTPGLSDAVDGLERALPRSTLPVDEIRTAIGGDELHAPAYVRTHAPTHPGRPRWYDRVPPIVRLHTAYDRLRGFPWAKSGPYTDAELADRLEERDDRPGQAD